MKKKGTSSPPVSIIIPTKNEGKVLPACLESLIHQHTRVQFEIIIVDTNSTDNTLDIAKKYGARIVSESKPGRNLARMAGVSHARGRILLFTEADCILPDSWVQTYADAFDAHANTVAFVGRYTFHESTTFLTNASRWLMPVFDTLFRIIHGHYAFRASNFAILTSALVQAGGFNLQAREFDDVELSMRVSKLGSIAYIPKPAISTGDRRVRGRLGRYIREVVTSYIRTCILKETLSQKVYADIR